MTDILTADIPEILKKWEYCRTHKTHNDCEFECRLGGYTVCTCEELVNRTLELLKEQQSQIEKLEHDLAITEDNLRHYLNGNE